MRCVSFYFTLLILFGFSARAGAGAGRVCLLVSGEAGRPDRAAEFETLVPAGIAGRSNRGVYTYVDPEGQAHAVKVLDFGPHDVDGERSFAAARRGAELQQSAGGPRLFCSGVLEIKEGPTKGVFYYVDLERLPPGIELKTDRLQDLHLLLATPEARETLPLEMAERLIDTLEKRIFASDPDLWIEPSGKARWLDSGEWRDLVSDRADIRYTAGTVWYFTWRLSLLDDRGAGPPMAPVFLKRFLSRLGHSSSIRQGDRLALVEGLADFPALDKSGALPPLVAERLLVRYGFLPPGQRNRIEATDLFHHYCLGAMRAEP